MKRLSTLLLFVLTLSSCDNKIALPVGFEHVSRDGRSHFILVDKKFWGERTIQRQVGRTICKEVFHEDDYCEVYYFSRREDVPIKFPIINRVRPIGIYTFKNNKETFRALSEKDPEAIRIFQ